MTQVMASSTFSMQVFAHLCKCESYDGYDIDTINFLEYSAEDLLRAIIAVLQRYGGTEEMVSFFNEMLDSIGKIIKRSDTDSGYEGYHDGGHDEWSYQVYASGACDNVFQDTPWWPGADKFDEDERDWVISIPLLEITNKIEEHMQQESIGSN